MDFRIILRNLNRFKGLFLFMLIIIFFHILYKSTEDFLVEIPAISGLISWLAHILLQSSHWILNKVFGITALVRENDLILPNEFSIRMLDGCTGLQQFILVTALFLLYPGPFKQKLWYIPLSLMLVFLMNLLRFVFLSMYCSYYPDHFSFVHDWVFRPFIYGVIFLSWWFWDRIFLPVEKQKAAPNI